MGTGWAVGFLIEIDDELLVHLQATLVRIAVDLHQPGTFLGDVGIELIIPSAVERVGDEQPFAILAELNHLRTAGDAFHR